MDWSNIYGNSRDISFRTDSRKCVCLAKWVVETAATWRTFQPKRKINPLSANPAQCSNTLKQFVSKSRCIVWVYLTLLWGWRLKGSKNIPWKIFLYFFQKNFFIYFRMNANHAQNFLYSLILQDDCWTSRQIKNSYTLGWFLIKCRIENFS